MARNLQQEFNQAATTDPEGALKFLEENIQQLGFDSLDEMTTAIQAYNTLEMLFGEAIAKAKYPQLKDQFDVEPTDTVLECLMEEYLEKGGW